MMKFFPAHPTQANITQQRSTEACKQSSQRPNSKDFTLAGKASQRGGPRNCSWRCCEVRLNPLKRVDHLKQGAEGRKHEEGKREKDRKHSEEKNRHRGPQREGQGQRGYIYQGGNTKEQELYECVGPVQPAGTF